MILPGSFSSLAGNLEQHEIAQMLGDALGDRLRALQDFGLGWGEPAVQTPQQREGQDDLAVFRGLVVMTEQLRDRPDQANAVALRVHRPSSICRTAICANTGWAY
jgi:hypothetical protein